MSHENPVGRPRRAFAMVLAIWLLAFVVLTMAALGAAMAQQSRRTLISSEDDQLRQLLLAGERVAAANTDALVVDHPLNVPLPRPLREEGYSLVLTLGAGDTPTDRTIEVAASLPHYHRAQELHFHQQQNRWSLVDATLN